MYRSDSDKLSLFSFTACKPSAKFLNFEKGALKKP